MLIRQRHKPEACATRHPRLIRVNPWLMKNSAHPVHPVKKQLSTGLTGSAGCDKSENGVTVQRFLKSPCPSASSDLSAFCSEQNSAFTAPRREKKQKRTRMKADNADGHGYQSEITATIDNTVFGDRSSINVFLYCLEWINPCFSRYPPQRHKDHKGFLNLNFYSCPL